MTHMGLWSPRKRFNPFLRKMALLTLTSLLLGVSLSLPLSAAPLTLGIWILIMGFLTGSLITLLMSSWIGMVTVLIYIGGLNVLFAYFAATSPNKHLYILSIIRITLLATTSILLNLLYYHPSLAPAPSFHHTLLFKKIYFGTDMLILLTLGVILFLALVIVVKISDRRRGPLRPFQRP